MVFFHPSTNDLVRQSNERILRAVAKVHRALDKRPSYWRGLRGFELEAIEDPIIEAARTLVQRLTEEELIGPNAPLTKKERESQRVIERLLEGTQSNDHT